MAGECARFVVGVGLAMWALALAPAAYGQNLIRNGGFEEGPSPTYPGVGKYWETNDALAHPDVDHLDSTVRHSGFYSQHLRANPTWDLGMLRQVTPYNSVVPGKAYRISAWIKTANVQNPAGWYVFGVWGFHDDEWRGEVKMPQQETLNYDWRLITIEMVAPANVNRLGVVLTRHTDGDAWYDDITVVEVTPQPQIEVTPASLAHTIVRGDALADDAFAVRNVGAGTLSYSIQADAGWLWPDPTSGTSTGESDSIAIRYATTGLAEGDYVGHVTVSDPNAANPVVSLTVTIHVGPWYAPADFDRDCDVDLSDFGFLQLCFNGPNRPLPFAECALADMDADHDVDLSDFAAFLSCFNGPNRPPACDR